MEKSPPFKEPEDLRSQIQGSRWRGTLQPRTQSSAATCSRRGKTLAGLLPLQGAQLSRGPQKCSPSAGFWSPQTLVQRTVNSRDRLPRRSPVHLSSAGLDGEKESGLRGILALGCSLFRQNGLGELGCGWLQTRHSRGCSSSLLPHHWGREVAVGVTRA